MDPNACYLRWMSAIADEDSEEAAEAYNALRAWLERGGFEPSWTPSERRTFFRLGPTFVHLPEPIACWSAGCYLAVDPNTGECHVHGMPDADC